MTHDEKIVEAVAIGLPELPRPSVCYADHSYPAFSAKQMQDYARAAITAYQAEVWHLITVQPDRPMVVLFYSQNCVWHDQHGNVAPEWPPERDEKYSLGFWDGDWFWMGTAHRVFEWDPVGHPDMPSHWSPVLLPPKASP